MTTQSKKSAADVRKGLGKSERQELTIKILPNIAFEEKGDYAVLKKIATRRVTNLVPQKDGSVKDESFNVHDVLFLEGSLETMTVGKDKTAEALNANTEVSLKGNARLDRGFEKLADGGTVMVEYLGKVDAGSFKAHDYLFDIVK